MQNLDNYRDDPCVSREQDATIAVMGSTGTGKSSFIKLVANDDSVVVGHSLESETNRISCTEYFDSKGRKVTLMDTPGFDDSRETMSDTDVLQMIGEHLTREYDDGRKLSGVIYTHNIANTRIGGISRRNLKMFQKLVGSDCLKNVVVVTTMWGTVEKDMGERREAELKSKDTLFKPLLDAGARIFRHDSGSKSAHKIIDIVSGNEPKELLIQVELSKGANLVDTTAGAELVAEFGRFDEEDRKKLRSLDRELNEAMEEKDEALVAELMRTRAKLEGWMRSREQDRAKLAQNVYSLGPVLGARAGHRITGLKKSGAVVGAVAAIAGVGLLAAGEVIEKCVGIPKERGVAKQVPAYIEIVEQKAGRFATKGEKALGQPGALAGGALGAAVGVAACVFKGLGHIAENA